MGSGLACIPMVERQPLARGLPVISSTSNARLPRRPADSNVQHLGERARASTQGRRMRRLIIQIPCLNEAATLPTALAHLPRAVEGFDEVQWLVIDDGSEDGTAEVARAHGVDHVIRFEQNRGLARAFTAGLEQALHLGADVIVNTDADNQYEAADIPKLVQPILDGRALMVVGERPISQIETFSPVKKLLQRLGTWVVRLVSRTTIRDAPSGFRAIHRDAAVMLNVFNDYTYTLETIIQAGLRGIPTASVPIRVNKDLRPSRLIRSIPRYIYRSTGTILRVFLIYRPFRFFMILAALTALPGIVFILRFLYFFALNDGGGHVQSLTLSAGLLAIAAMLAVCGILADLLATNRILLEDIRRRLLQADIAAASRTAHDA
jgi:glycosyltransferase involved in cell wall biosynthesis